MNYKIEKLLQADSIKCHEIRSTMYGGQHLLLHFFITQPSLVDALPVFKIGYETYGVSSKDLVSDDSKPLESLIKDYALLTSSDNVHSIFNFGDTTKNEWTGEQAELLNQHGVPSSLSPQSPENISMNKNLRYVSEMADNSIYSGEDIISTPNYLSDKDSTLINQEATVITSNDNNSNITDNSEDNKKSHSIWTSDIHFSKFKHCSNEELYELFKKYKSYIDLTIPVELDTESRLNIDMVNLFGASFDVVRIQNQIFNDNYEEINDKKLSSKE